MSRRVRYFCMVGLVLALLISLCVRLNCVKATVDDFGDSESENGYVTVFTEDGKELFVTGSNVFVGDQYQSGDDKLYEVYKVDSDMAYAKYLEDVNVDAIEVPDIEYIPVQGKKGKIAIYHTHTDESYVPTDGIASEKGKGGIFDVGSALAAALEKKGIEVVMSKSPHDPHDSGAYKRSRRTAVSLLKKNPDAIIDVHRDAVPAKHYAGKVSGQNIAKVRLVVGRQNPNKGVNQKFAQSLKKISDQKYPGLVKDIFYAKGGYNQDLSPRAILVEAGTHKVSKDRAKNGVALFADVITTYLYGTAAGAGRPRGAAGTAKTGAGGSILWLLLLAVVGGIIFVLINAGSVKDIKSSLTNLGKKKFSSTLADLEDVEDPDKGDE